MRRIVRQALLAATLIALVTSLLFSSSVPSAPSVTRSPGSRGLFPARATLMSVTHPAPSAAIPAVQGPIPGRPSIALSTIPLSQFGYSESEFFFSGTATSYSTASPLMSDGKWTAQPASSAPYKSRMIVVRPTNPAKFSGTVVVEWLNVTAGFDSAPDWQFGRNQMLRSGDVYVGVSAQASGVNQAKSSDPVRYASLVHPGDSFSYDIYSQAGMAIRDKASTVLSGLKSRIVIADGESQSAYRMVTYVDAVAPVNNVFDAYMIHSTGSGGDVAPLSEVPQAAIPTPDALRIRSDLTVPVLMFETETDVLGPLDYYPATQPDSPFFRLWEVAGTSHADAYEAIQAGSDDMTWASDANQFASMMSPPQSLSVAQITISCPEPFNTGEEHYVFDTAIQDLTSWTRTGLPPRKMPRFEISTSTTSPSYELDKSGNVLGGVRTPAVDAPVATLSGLPGGGPQYCEFFGQTHPFTPSHMSALYPTHADFVRQWRLAVAQDLRAGYLLPADASRLAASS